ncbi:uncharacterized protein LOC112566610 [Pomacea canaliculata]|uniref:uncharacterized protein LOC112566610 n=1 Tax=Pomacea canaliculata TaxID=400727 RepID=UPI000D7362EE|nr:uncharacterized protein LOC112566610 [Pomacea canaliculata]
MPPTRRRLNFGEIGVVTRSRSIQLQEQETLEKFLSSFTVISPSKGTTTDIMSRVSVFRQNSSGDSSTEQGEMESWEKITVGRKRRRKNTNKRLQTNQQDGTSKKLPVTLIEIWDNNFSQGIFMINLYSRCQCRFCRSPLWQ